MSSSIAWTIAGSDSGGGAGIQADLLTFNDFGVHGCSVITALTAQNSLSVQQVSATGQQSLSAQLAALHTDQSATAIKLGMLANSDTVRTVSDYLADYQGFVVCDPVLQSTSGTSLLDKGGEAAFLALLPHIDLLTPNIFEAEKLSGMAIESTQQLQQAAEKLLQLGARSVLITGGHFAPVNQQRLDYWTDGNQSFWLAGENIHTEHTHGSGCTLSSAITAAVASGYELWDALVLGKAYTTQGIRHHRQPGSGPGCVGHHGFPTELADLPRLQRQPEALPALFADCGDELGLYPVVDSVEWLEKLLPLGITTIQLRIKEAPANLADLIKRAVELSRQYQARLFINDYWQLAIEHGAYGVHLGQEDLDNADLNAIAEAGLRLGVSTHSYYEIARAHAIEPSYIAIGPIYPTTTKVMKFSERGLNRLATWVALLKDRYPLTAIGGINEQRAPLVLATGVKSCAMVTAITEAPDYPQVVSNLLELHQQILD